MPTSNLLKCKFCGWRTVKWSQDSTIEKAFTRLFKHIESDHPEQDELLDQLKANMVDRASEEQRRFDSVA